MGRRIVYCESCGLRLSEDDFQLGKAGLHLLRPFCAPCKPLPAGVLEQIPAAAGRLPGRRLRPLRRPASGLP
jgi:hypothetical protein